MSNLVGNDEFISWNHWKKSKHYWKIEKLPYSTKVFDDITELGGPPMTWDSMLISLDELEIEVSKLKDKWPGELDNLSYFSEDNIQTWNMDYINLNNNISIIFYESHDDLIENEK